MRIGIALFSLLLLVAFSVGSARAQLSDLVVTYEWVVDPLIGGGGYMDITATNSGTEAAYIVAIGDNRDINVVYTSPSQGGKWSGWVVPKGDWQANDVGWILYSGFTPPNTATELVWGDYFPTNFQCVLWQARMKVEAIQPGETLMSLRYLIGEGAKRSDPGPLPYVAIGDDGQVLGSGMTVPAGVVPTEGASFGRVKQLFAR